MGSEKLRSIRRYHIRNSRALDVARWRYHFEDGSEQEVLSALAAYQNTDGGFGHGLEPDVRSPYSSPAATLAAVRILQEMEFPSLASNMYRHLLDYLEKTLDPMDRWPAAMPHFNDFPHAPWWHYDKETSVWGWNPTVELAAFVLTVSKANGPLQDKAQQMIKDAFSQLLDPAYAPERHELTNFARAGEMLLKERPELIPEGFWNRMKEILLKTVELDPDEYKKGDYIATPDIVLNSPESPFYGMIREAADLYRSYLEESVNASGFWPIPWTWGNDVMPSDSTRDWQGVLIMEHMLYLHHFRPKENR